MSLTQWLIENFQINNIFLIHINFKIMVHLYRNKHDLKF